MTRPSEDALFLNKEIIDALKRSEEKHDEKMEKLQQKISDSVGAQLHGMNSAIVKNEEEDDRYKQINEGFTDIEKKILEVDKKYESKSEESKGAHVDRSQGKAVTTRFHNETSEPEVIQLLKESKTGIGITMENVSRSHMLLFTSRTMKNETNLSGQRTCKKKKSYEEGS